MKMNYWIVFPLILLQGIFVSASSGKYINTQCTAKSDCGLNTHLQCINNYCQCDSLSQIYDGSTHKCLLLLGQKCEIPTERLGAEQSPPISCVPHADCSIPSSVCQCKLGYRASPDFLCKPDFGTPCFAQDDCDELLGLSCVQGTCQCHNVTLSYQGKFGCIDPATPEFKEMLHLLNQTQFLLKENNLELRDIFNDLGLQNDPQAMSLLDNMLQERQFQDTYNTNDLQFAAQNQNSQTAGGGGGFNIGQLLNLFQSLQSIFGRNGAGGGFFRNLFGGGNNQGGYPDASTTSKPSAVYGAPGEPAGMGQRMGLLNSFINLFNQMIPIVRQLRMRFNPIRFFQNLLNRFVPPTSAPPTQQSIQQLPPTVIQSNGNYNTNPLFNQGSNGGTQGVGTLQFFQRTRDRFRNFLRGNRGNSAGGYSYPPGNSYGAPAPAPASPTEAEQPQDESQQFPNQSPTPNRNTNSFQTQQVNQPQYNTVDFGGQTQPPPVASTPRDQRQQNFNDGSLPRPSTFNSGAQPNHQSFYSSQPQQPSQTPQSAPAQVQTPSPNLAHLYQNQPSPQPQQRPQQPQFSQTYNNNPTTNSISTDSSSNQQDSYNTQASHQQTTYITQPPQPLRSQYQLQSQRPPQPFRALAQSQFSNQNSNNANSHEFSIIETNVNTRPVTNSPTSPLPRFKLSVPSKIPASTLESLSQNFILSEADDPHPGFTPISTSSAPEAFGAQDSFRTSARFERLGEEEQPSNGNNAAENWRESF